MRLTLARSPAARAACRSFVQKFAVFLENQLGAFLASVALVGGVHAYSFAVLFIGYTTLNVINHAGLNFQRFPLRTMGMLAVKHDKHHHSMRSGNYAFLTTLPDTLFGTVE